MRNNKGFTLIELLVVVLIIGVLAAIALPQYFKAAEKSRFSEVADMLQTIYTAQHRFYLTHNEYAENYDLLDVNFSDTSGEPVNEDILPTASFEITAFATLNSDLGGKEEEKSMIVADRIKNDDVLYAIYKDLETADLFCEDKNENDNITCDLFGFDDAHAVQYCASKGTLGNGQGECPVCPRGLSWNGSKCICAGSLCPVLTCPDEYCWNGTECIRALECSLVNEHICPPEYKWDDELGQCACSTKPCTKPVCPEEYMWNDTECIQVETSTECEEGYSWNGKECELIANEEDNHICPSGASWNGSECACSTPPCVISTVCPKGYSWNGKECEETPKCEEGYIWNGTECKPEEDETLCPSGYFWNGTECEEYIIEK